MFGKIRQLIKKSHTIHLTKDELIMGREKMSAYMAKYPVVRNAEDARHIWQRPLFLTNRPMFATIATIMILALSGGTAAAAEGSVPGNPLYPIKVHVNEQVRAALAISPQAQANWEARRVERRLEETATLVGQNKLTATTSLKIARQFEKQADHAEKIIEKLKEHGNVETASALEAQLNAALEAHEKILSNLEGKTRVEIKIELRNTLTPIFKKAQEELRNLRRAEHATSTSSTPEKMKERRDPKAVSEHAMKKSQHKIETVEKLLKKVKEKFGADLSAQAGIELTETKRVHAEGVKLHEAENYQKAIESFVKAEGLAHQVHIILNFHRRFTNRHELIPKTVVTTSVGQEFNIKVKKGDENDKQRDRGPFKLNPRFNAQLKTDLKL